MKERKRKQTVMVSSTVHGLEELLDRIYALLTQNDYEVWMSYKGTVPVRSDQTAFESCIKAVGRIRKTPQVFRLRIRRCLKPLS